MAAVSAKDVWAVGNYYSSKKDAEETLIDHWNGKKWTVASNPNPSSSENSLYGVAAVSASNIWAVGAYTDNSSGNTELLIEHWNGTRWAVVPSPSPGAGAATLSDVAAASANKVWAVGQYCNSSGNTQTLIEYWDGSTWSIIPSPNPGSDSLNAVAVVSANNVWAVGLYEANYSFNTLIEHWDGTQWSVVPSPSPGSVDNTLFGVTGGSANNIWAVGRADQGLGDQTLIEHWNGSKWSVVSSPNGGPGDNELFGVAKVPFSKEVWAVGQYNNGNTTQTLFEYHHW